MNTNETIKNQVIILLRQSHANVDFDKAVADLTLEDIGKKIDHLPYTIWQLVEHIRITQQDLLDFSENANYQAPEWPADYWVHEPAPATLQQWEESLAAVNISNAAFIDLIARNDENLLKPLAHGEGQTLLRNAIVVIDHRGYHTAEIVMIRRLMGKWK